MIFVEAKTSRLLVACTLGIGLVLLLLGPLKVWGQEGTGQPVNLDVILLIDNSWSMSRGDPATEAPPSDPEQMRIRAARFLVDYLRANAETVRSNYRVGVVSFGGEVGDVIPLRLLQGEAVREGIHAEEIRLTDFRDPLQLALQELEAKSFGTGNRMAVLLFTDGRPHLTVAPMTEGELRAYFEDLAPLAGDLQEEGASVFVVGIRDAQGDRDNWIQIVPQERYFSVTSTEQLVGVSRHILADLTGAAVPEASAIPAGQAVFVDVEPYLERVLFSFIKSDPAIDVILISPFGAIVAPTTGGTAEVHHAIYSIRDPDPGRWKAFWEGEGEVRYWVERQYPLIRVEPARSSSPVGQPITITASLVRDNEPVVDPDLHLEAKITLPDGDVVTQALSPIGEGRHTGSYEDVKAEGTYTVTARASLDGQPLVARTSAATVDVFLSPAVATPITTPSPSATPTPVEGVGPTPTLSVVGPPSVLGGLAWPLIAGLSFAFGLGLAALLWWLRSWVPGHEGKDQFLEAIRSYDYPVARALLDKAYNKDELKGVTWFYLGEEDVCRRELYVMGPRRQAGGKVLCKHKSFADRHLRKAGEKADDGDLQALRDECALVLQCIKLDSFPHPLDDRVQKPFVKWFDGAVGIELDEPRGLAELLQRTEDPDAHQLLCRAANARRVEIEREEWEEVIPAYRKATAQAFSANQWKGVVDLWAVGEQDIARLFQRFLARFTIGKHQEEGVLDAILQFVNSGGFDETEEFPGGFWEALSGIFEYASAEARDDNRRFSYLIYREYARLLWDVAHDNAKGILTTLLSIPDALAMYDQDEDLALREDVYYLCYFLVVLDPERLSDGREIYFYAEAEEGLRRGSRYKDLPDLLAPLKGLRLATATATLQEVQDSISQSSLGQFEKAMITSLLRELERVSKQFASETAA